jgi:hypothetical protein
MALRLSADTLTILNDTDPKASMALKKWIKFSRPSNDIFQAACLWLPRFDQFLVYLRHRS